MRRAVLAVLLLALTTSTACASGLGVGRADTLAPGKYEVGGSAELALGLLKRGPGRPVPLPTYALGGQLRRGVYDGVDVGARAWAGAIPGMVNAGIAADAKLQFLGLRRRDGWDGALSVGLVYDRLDVGGAWSESWGVNVPILFGLSTGGGSQLTFGPRFCAQVVLAESSVPQTLGFGGLSLAYAWRAGEHLEVRPELVATYAPVGWNGLIDSRDRQGLTLIELGVSVLWLP